MSANALTSDLHSSAARKGITGKRAPERASSRDSVDAAANVSSGSPLRDERAVYQKSKMEAIGQLAGGIAHDFNNLLTVILGHSEMLLNRAEPAKARRMRTEEIRKAAERGAWLTSQLLAYSRNQHLEPMVLHLNDVLEDISGILRHIVGEDVAIELHLDSNLGWVKVDRGQLQQIALNLAGNARDAMPRGGRLRIETSNVTAVENGERPRPFVAPGEYVCVLVRDTGHGMDADTCSRIFEPFFTTKEKGKGTGLGLATVYGIVKQSGGYIWVESEPGRGSAFHTLLPRVPEPAERGVPREALELRYGGETVLLAEDDPALRSLAAEFLRLDGYNVMTAASGADAIRAAKEHAGPIDLLLTDVVMPEMTGRELAGRLVRRFPKMKVLYMSGYTDDAIGNHGLRGETLRVMQKPFTHEILSRRVREKLESGFRP